MHHTLPVDCNDIETDACVRRDDLRVVGGDTTKGRSLRATDGRERRAKIGAFTSLHFYDNQSAPIQKEQVYLAAGQLEVSSKQAVADLAKEPFGPFFAAAPERASLPAHARSRAAATGAKLRRW